MEWSGLHSLVFLPLGLIVPGLATWGMMVVLRKAERVTRAREMVM